MWVETDGEGIQHTWVGVGACIIARRGPSTAGDVDTSCGVTGLLVVCGVHVWADVQSQYICKLYSFLILRCLSNGKVIPSVDR